VPTDRWRFGYTPKFRKSDEHAADIRAVVQDLRKPCPGAKVFLIGTSQGATSAAELADRFQLITVKGGTPVQDNGCGPMGPHGFLGREQAVAAEIKNWMHGRPYLNTIH